ncbi:OmpA family protein [Thalassobellus citreus]|uniref:OmpA family protein n=1 Tax=Thalassobellus citreus TaxID=3367752 RepID=UPI0037A98E51
MKTKFFILIFFLSLLSFSQETSNIIAENHFSINNKIFKKYTSKVKNKADEIGPNGFNFDLLKLNINSEYSEISSGFFRNKAIMVSSKKLGPFAKKDPKTGEGYKDLYCLDIDKNGRLSKPLLFSRILNSKYNEGQLSFSPDQNTVYYTRSIKENSSIYKLYKAILEKDSHGNWINQELLSINKEGFSIENPYVSHQGDKLYFSSNMPDGIGGFDLYVSTIKKDGSLGNPKNLGKLVNTPFDDKYPSLSKDDKYLYFSSKGHRNVGGFDVFVSKISSKNEYRKPRNLGVTINSYHNEIAYTLAAKNKGYVTSNREYKNGRRSYDIYTAINEEIIQTLKGKVFDLKAKKILPNSVVILKDDEGVEISRSITDSDAAYSFNVIPFENYTISVSKENFDDLNIDFLANRSFETTYFKNLELSKPKPAYDVERELRLVADNIFFDSNKSNIKKELHRILNKIIYVLNEHPEMKLAINAHTDNVGKDSFNLKLSNDRAASVLNYLVTNGISKDRLRSKGYGETEPLIDCGNNCSKEQLQTNRRVELVIINR